MRRATTLLALGVLALACAPPLLARKTMELVPVKVGVGPLFPTRAETIRVLVQDERAERDVYASGLGGPGVDKGKGAFLGFFPDKPEDLARHMEAAAGEAVEILGFRKGEGATLQIALKELRVDVFWFMWSPFNCTLWAKLEITLPGEGGPATRPLLVTLYESTARPPKELLSSLYARVAWQAAATALHERYPAEADPEKLRKLAAMAQDRKAPQNARTHATFWLGLLGRPYPTAVDALLPLFRGDEEQSVYQAAAGSLALLKAPGAQDELLAVASGATKLEEWDPTELEEGWHLVRALHILGTADLAGKLPRVTKLPEKLNELLAFLEKGVVPERSARHQEELAEAKAKLRK